MKRILTLAVAVVALSACGEGEAESTGRFVCDAYVDACSPTIDQCFDEFAKFSGHKDHDACAREYLAGRACQAGIDPETGEDTGVPKCEIPGPCGDRDPYDQMIFCVEFEEEPEEDAE